VQSSAEPYNPLQIWLDGRLKECSWTEYSELKAQSEEDMNTDVDEAFFENWGFEMDDIEANHWEHSQNFGV
jgi:hypothetical protein